MAQMVKNLSAMRETWVQSLGWEDPLEKGMATHSSMLAWRIPMDKGAWQATVHWVIKVRHDWMTQHRATTGFTRLLSWTTTIINVLSITVPQVMQQTNWSMTKWPSQRTIKFTSFMVQDDSCHINYTQRANLSHGNKWIFNYIRSHCGIIQGKAIKPRLHFWCIKG